MTVSDKDSGPVMCDYLALSLGSPTGSAYTFWYGDVRELPDEEARVETVEKLGEAVLLIECADGGKFKAPFLSVAARASMLNSW